MNDQLKGQIKDRILYRPDSLVGSNDKKLRGKMKSLYDFIYFRIIKIHFINAI